LLFDTTATKQWFFCAPAIEPITYWFDFVLVIWLGFGSAFFYHDSKDVIKVK
jgi:hypothetical protein